MDEQSHEIRELEQYGRRNNVKIYGLKEEKSDGRGETADETVAVVCKLFSDRLGVPV